MKNLRGFFALTGYYRKLVLNYGRTVAPLTSSLNKGVISWTPEENQYFKQLKLAMYKALVFATPYFTKTFIMECDASRNGIGVVLMQEGHPLSFTSNPIKEKN